MAMTVESVAADLGVTIGLVYREIKNGNLKAFRVGSRTLRIRKEDLEEYKQRNYVQNMEEI